MSETKKNVTNMTAPRMELLEKHMDDNNRETTKKSMDYHKVHFVTFACAIKPFDNKKFEEYVKEYCEDDDNFENIVIEEKAEKPKRVLTPEHLAKMQEGRRKKAEAKKAAAGSDSEKEEKAKSDSEKEDKKPKARKPKNAAAH